MHSSQAKALLEMARLCGVSTARRPTAASLAPCPPSASPAPRPWPPESLESERKFGAPYARLFPFIGRKVRTPEGSGVLLQVFRERCAVVLDMEASQYMHFFPPAEIEPVSWMVGEEDLSPHPSRGILESRQRASGEKVIDDH